MFYDEFEKLCREAWKEKNNCFLRNWLEDINGKNICNESNPENKIFIPQTDPF